MLIALRAHLAAGGPAKGAVGASVSEAEARSEQVATITVRRQSEDDAGIREIFVSVDGESIAILKHGEAVTHDLPAGPHRLKAHNTLFWKTHELVLQPGEHARFNTVNKVGWGSFGFLTVLGAAPLYLVFERDEKE